MNTVLWPTIGSVDSSGWSNPTDTNPIPNRHMAGYLSLQGAFVSAWLVLVPFFLRGCVLSLNTPTFIGLCLRVTGIFPMLARCSWSGRVLPHGVWGLPLPTSPHPVVTFLQRLCSQGSVSVNVFPVVQAPWCTSCIILGTFGIGTHSRTSCHSKSGQQITKQKNKGWPVSAWPRLAQPGSVTKPWQP